jgi:hypothetical protein
MCQLEDRSFYIYDRIEIHELAETRWKAIDIKLRLLKTELPLAIFTP